MQFFSGGGGGSPEQSQRVVFESQLDENYLQSSARQARPRSWLQARALAFNAKGEKAAEPVLSKQTVLADDVKFAAKGGVPAPVRENERSRVRNLMILSLRREGERKEHVADQSALLSFCESRNSVTIDNRCVGFDRSESPRCAFTMAEILLSLTIIGVVAAITLPSLTGNINERTWNTQRKALYARFSQAIALMPSLNGYGTLTEESSAGAGDAEDTAAETFVTDGLAKVLKINNICDNEHLDDCGIPSKLTTMAGSVLDKFPTKMSELNDKLVDYSYVGSGWNTGGTDRHYSYSQLDTKAAAFETQNGESLAVFYNPNCKVNISDSTYYTQQFLCANFVYDLNGNKGPNTVGKDIGFITALYPTDSVIVAPMPLSQNAAGTATQQEAGKLCQAQDSHSRVPNIDEITAMVFNQKLLGMPTNSENYFWSSSLASGQYVGRGYLQGFIACDRFISSRAYKASVRCIKR